MAENTTLARPYAVALYKRAKETGNASNWSDQLTFLASVLSDEGIQRAAANPKTKRNEFTSALLDLCQGHLDTEGQNLVRLLIQNHRLNLVATIRDLFLEYQADDEGYIDVTVTSAYALNKEESAGLEKTLQRVLKKQPRLKTSIDKSLIGGVYIRAGDRIIDASLRGQVERLAKQLSN